jgi:hypothetical protein
MSSIIRATTSSGLQVAPDNSGSLQLQTNGTTTAVTIDTSQNVGIGTTSPSQKLQVSDGGDTGDVRIQLGNTRKLELIRNSTFDNWIRSSSTGADFYIDQNANANLIMRTNATERMRIDSNGNVGIGATTLPNPGTPSERTLTVSATMYPQIFTIATTATANNTTYRTISRDTGVYQIQLINDAATTEQTAYEISRSANSVSYQRWYGGTTEAMRIDSGGNLLFNSGYGSVATAYGCRAWINFSGQGTPTIRASGNVSSITDNGTGNYTINFTTAMPDTNYNITGFGRRDTANFAAIVLTAGSTDAKTTSTCQVRTGFATTTAVDLPEVGISFFR